MWSITSPPRRQSTPRFPNSGITSTGMPKQWPSSAMTTRQSLPFREMLPSAVNNGRPGLSRPAMPSTTRELMIVRSLPVSTRHEKQRPLSLAGTTGIRLFAVCTVAPSSDTAVPLTAPLLEGPSASLRATLRPSGRTRRPDSIPPDENPPPQGGPSSHHRCCPARAVPGKMPRLPTHEAITLARTLAQRFRILQKVLLLEIKDILEHYPRPVWSL
ncbi:hypothetical protein GQR58_004075 [Nymphon striatum]|nr:hypothetical protein GQR58_004075 [Nymphon striatum]